MEPDFEDRYREALGDALKGNRCLAADCYREPAAFDVEIERVLRPGWHAVARWDALPEPGDFRSVDLFGEPLVIVRGEDDALRVFSRVCRHRAHNVVEGTGHADHLVCPYHRWSYGLDGKLRGAPVIKDQPGFDAAGCGLPELRSECWQGFLLASLDADAAPIAPQLGELDGVLAGRSYAELVTVGIMDFDSPWNWKIMVENFMESYHHLGPHRETFQPRNPAQNTYCAEHDGPFSVLENPGVEPSASFQVFQVFPTLLFFMMNDAPIGTWYEMQIDRHDHFQLRIHTLAAPDLANSKNVAKELSEMQRKVHLEDIPVCEGVQRGIASQLWQPGPLSTQERALARFHRHLADRIAP